jgi:molecular chaperone GrpE
VVSKEQQSSLDSEPGAEEPVHPVTGADAEHDDQKSAKGHPKGSKETSRSTEDAGAETPPETENPAQTSADEPPHKEDAAAPHPPKRPEAEDGGASVQPPVRKPTEHEILARLLEKNEIIMQLTRKNTQLEAKYKVLKDKRLRTLAEYENYRKRTQKEWELLKQQSQGEVILEVLNVVDDFERALAVVGERNDEVVQGVRLIYGNLLATLERFGVTRMETLHAPFDPKYHMAVAHLESKDVESNHVMEIVQHGYTINGNVLRPAKVVIAK